MVRIKDFKVYPWDTRQTVTDRLAANMNTLPKYLYLSERQDWDSFLTELRDNSDVEVGDLLRDIRDYDSVVLATLLNKIGDPVTHLEFLINTKLDIMVDIIQPFIVYNTRLESAKPDMRRGLLLMIKRSVQDRSIPTEKIWLNRDRIIRDITRDIDANKENVRDNQVLVDTEGLPHTNFIRQEAVLRLEFDFQGLTLLEVFDKIKLTPRVPFASVNNLYKILRDFTPDPNWGAMEGSIYFQFRATPPTEAPVFFDTILVVEGDAGNEKGILETGPIKYKYGTTVDDFLRNFQEIFQSRLQLDISSYGIPREKGKFYYNLGKEHIDSYVLGELVLNDPLFNQYLAIDEHESATKGKRSSTYIHFFGGGGDEQTVKANITVYQVRDKDEVIRKYGYLVGDYYLNVLVSKVKSGKDLEDFILIFGKLLKLYYSKAPEIIKIYQDLLHPLDPDSAPPANKKFPPTYKPRKALVKGKKMKATLKEQAPEVFVSGYPTKCGNQPRIISTEEARNEENVVMRYPKTTTEGFTQRWYVCDQDISHPYPGLRINDLSNNNIVPYLPCCFKTKQDLGPKGEVGKQTKPYSHYFYDIPVVDGINTSQQNLLMRDLFTDPPKVAALPKELEEMLNLITYKQGWRFVRSGVFDSKTSFLECVLEALQTYSGRSTRTKKISEEIGDRLIYKSDKVRAADAAFNKAKKNKVKRDVLVKAEAILWNAKKEERIQFLNDLRIKLSTQDSATCCRQEMYDYTQNEILQTISDPDIYFDPRFLTNLIEKHFHCKIVLFSRVNPILQENKYQGSINTVLTLPRHTQAYYKTQENVPTILIYERLGRGSEQKEYPRCELISYWDGARELTTLHDADTKVSSEMHILYERVRESYNLNCIVPQTILPFSELTKIGFKFTHQEIDSYGKCRALIFDYNDQKGSLLVTPMQPFLLPRFQGTVTQRLSLDLAQELLRKLKIDADRVSIAGDHVIAYSGIIGNTRFSLPFVPRKHNPPVGLSTEEDLISRDQTGSKLRSYIADKRISRYMVEYSRWLYSKFLSEKNIQDSVKSLRAFITTQIKVDKKYKYNHVAKIFSMTSGVSKNGVLYVRSDETRKRLIYTLQLYALHHPWELKQYKSRTSISNYYLNVGDFTRYRSQVILQGDNAVLKWVYERGQDYSLHNEVITSDKMDELRENINELSARLTRLQKSSKYDDTREILTDRLEDEKSEYEKLYSVMLGSPRFFKNRLVGDNEMYLYQESVGLSHALRICDIWKRGVNDARTINESKEDSIPEKDFTIYAYQSPTKVTPYVCDDGCRTGENDGVTVLGYRNEENDPTFISLLPLGPCRR